MKTKIISSLLAVTAATGIVYLAAIANSSPIFSTPQPTAQSYRKCDRHYLGQTRPSGYFRRYHSNKVETINAQIIAIEKIAPHRRRSFSGVRLLVKTEDNILYAHLGPSWYVSKQDFQLTPKTRIKISGSKTYLAGKETIIARELEQGNKVLLLRDNKGIPLWCGWMSHFFLIY